MLARTRSQAGFSLIEILVVVFIIGLLATIVGVNVFGASVEAKQKKAMADMSAIGGALDLYRLDNGRYPTTSQGLIALIEKPSSGPEVRKYRSGGYLDADEVPLDPWNTEYVYLSNGKKYDLLTYGADGESGGEDEDRDITSRDKDL